MRIEIKSEMAKPGVPEKTPHPRVVPLVPDPFPERAPNVPIPDQPARTPKEPVPA